MPCSLAPLGEGLKPGGPDTHIEMKSPPVGGPGQ